MDNLSESDKKILSLCMQNKKLFAIKWAMQVNGWTLTKSKEYVENLEQEFKKLREKDKEYAEKLLQNNESGEKKISNEIDEMVIHLCKSGKKIEAIALVNETTQWGLKQSKEYVEHLIQIKK